MSATVCSVTDPDSPSATDLRPRKQLMAVTPYGPSAGSSRVRVFDWAQRVQDSVTVHPYAGLPTASPSELIHHPLRVAAAERTLRALARSRPECLLLHREASPLSRGGIENQLLRKAQFSVYDFDDALYCDVGEGPLYRRLAPKAVKAQLAASQATRVIAGNEILADWASQHNRDVVVIPSCVDPSAYDPKTSYELHDPPRIGWVGSWSTERHLRSITKPLMQLHAETGARLALVGAPRSPGESRLGDLEALVDRIPWSLDAQRHEVAQFDIAIMPLVDDPYSRGKCGYKLLQYLAAGVPSVASPVGVNETILQRAELPSAATDDDWYEAMVTLLSAATESRAGMGALARDTAIEHYSFDAWRAVWRRATGLGQ